MNQREKILIYGCLLISILCALVVIGAEAYPGTENLTLATVDDARVNPNQAIIWSVQVLDNTTSWVNITIMYNAVTTGPYNITLTPLGVAVVNQNAPATPGYYTVNITTIGATQNVTYPNFMVDHYLIDLDAAFTETEAGFNALILATGYSQLDGHTIGVNESLNVLNLGAFTWNSNDNVFYQQVSSSTPLTRTYNTITSFNEDTYGITSAEIDTTVTITWTQGTMDRLITSLSDGDILGTILEENTRVFGVLFTYTAMMAILSVGIYNVSGFYATVFVWIIGWGIFSGVTHGNAQLLAFLFIGLAGAAAITKTAIDRRNS